MQRLDESVAIVTGASSGIGFAVAEAFAREGATVVLAARRKEALEESAASLRAHGARVSVVPTDVRSREAVTQLVDKTIDRFGRLDTMVNNAGVGHWEPAGVATGDPANWRDEIEINVLGVMWGTWAAARIFVEQGRGDIVNVSSLAGRAHAGEIPGYVTSKHGVNAFTYSALKDLRPKGVRVTLVEPGTVATPMQPDEELGTIPMLAAEDVARAILFAVTQPETVCVPNLAVIPMPPQQERSA